MTAPLDSRYWVSFTLLGPLALALIAGSSNLVSPQATEAAVLPAFLFLSVNMLLVALGFGFLGVETHGRPMALGDETATVVPAGAASARERDEN